MHKLFSLLVNYTQFFLSFRITVLEYTEVVQSCDKLKKDKLEVCDCSLTKQQVSACCVLNYLIYTSFPKKSVPGLSE